MEIFCGYEGIDDILFFVVKSSCILQEMHFVASIRLNKADTGGAYY